MFDQEFRSSRLELRVANTSESLTERSVGGSRISVSSRASVVESGEDSRRTLLFDQVANDFVVEVIDRSPLRDEFDISAESSSTGNVRTNVP